MQREQVVERRSVGMLLGSAAAFGVFDMRYFLIWTVTLIVFALLQPLVPGVGGVWLRVLVITAAFDMTHRISWRPWWQTGLRALAALAVSVLIHYQMPNESEAAGNVWTLLMAMNYGAFQTMFLMDRILYGTPAAGFEADRAGSSGAPQSWKRNRRQFAPGCPHI